MQEKHSAQGFVLIAQHRQGADLKGKVMALAQQQGINYSITQGGNIPGDQGKGIPRAVIFDWTGKKVASGHPNELYSKVDELMAQAPAWITGGREFKDPALRKVAGKLKHTKSYTKVLKELDGLLEGETAEGATYLQGRINGYGQSLLDVAQKNESQDALKAMSGYSQVSGLFKGCPQGDQAKQRLKELKKDKAFQRELKASKILAAITEQTGLFKATGGKINLEYPANRKPAHTIMGYMKMLKKKYSDTQAYARAQEAIKPFGL